MNKKDSEKKTEFFKHLASSPLEDEYGNKTARLTDKSQLRFAIEMHELVQAACLSCAGIEIPEIFQKAVMLLLINRIQFDVNAMNKYGEEQV